MGKYMRSLKKNSNGFLTSAAESVGNAVGPITGRNGDLASEGKRRKVSTKNRSHKAKVV
jgi:hypothetical protein